MVLIISFLVSLVIRMLCTYERHHSEDTKNRSVFLRLVVLKYINTSCIFLINNNSLINKLVGINRTTTVEYTSEWYQSIGVTIILVQLGDLLASQLGTVGEILWKKYLFHQAMTIPGYTLTQESLNNIIEALCSDLSD